MQIFCELNSEDEDSMSFFVTAQLGGHEVRELRYIDRKVYETSSLRVRVFAMWSEEIKRRLRNKITTNNLYQPNQETFYNLPTFTRVPYNKEDIKDFDWKLEGF